MIFTRRGRVLGTCFYEALDEHFIRLGDRQTIGKEKKHRAAEDRHSGDFKKVVSSSLSKRIASSTVGASSYAIGRQLLTTCAALNEFCHQTSSHCLRKREAYEENPAALNVRHCEIFSHAEQLLNGESAAC